MNNSKSNNNYITAIEYFYIFISKYIYEGGFLFCHGVCDAPPPDDL